MSSIRTRRAMRLLPVLALSVAALVVGQSASASTLPPGPGDSVPVPTIPDGYVRLVDDAGVLTVFVPETWTTVDTAPVINDGGSSQPGIYASGVDSETFDNTFASGVRYGAYPYQADPEAVIEAAGLTAGCETIAVQPYQDPIFTGFVQVGTNCGAGGGTWNMIVASPADQSFTAVVVVQIEAPADQEALEIVLQTFTYAGDPSVPPEVMVPSIPGSTVPG